MKTSSARSRSFFSPSCFIFYFVVSIISVPASLFVSPSAHASTHTAVPPIVCADKKDCPGWFAHLQTSTGGNCSSFLLKSDVIATNRHCLPEDIRSTRDSCKGKISFNFPETDRYKFDTRGCESIVDIAEQMGDEFVPLDITIIKLDKALDRETVDFTQSGIGDNAPLTIYKYDPTPQGGVVRKVECIAIQKSIINPYFLHNQSPVVFFQGCPIIKGNSGSAILIGKNQAAAIVSNLSAIMTPNSVKADIGIKVAGNGGHGTNFSCLNTSFLGYNKGYDPACRVKLDDRYSEELKQKLLEESALAHWKKAEKLMMERLQKEATAQALMPFDSGLAGHRANAPGLDSKYVQSYELTPTCARWATMMNDGGKTTRTQLKIMVPEVETDLDPHYRFITKTIDRWVTIDVSWNFKQIQNGKNIDLNWIETGRYAKRKTYTLKPCPMQTRSVPKTAQ